MATFRVETNSNKQLKRRTVCGWLSQGIFTHLKRLPEPYRLWMLFLYGIFGLWFGHWENHL